MRKNEIKKNELKKREMKNAIKRAKVVLDPLAGSESAESAINLAVSLELAVLLEEAGVSVVMTREGEQALSPQVRAVLANEQDADLFVSWGCDRLEDAGVSGVSLWVSEQPELSTLKLDEMLIEVEQIGSRVCELSGQLLLGVFQEPNATLAACRMPSVEVRGAFLTHAGEKSLCTQEKFLQAQARGAAVGILEWLSAKGKWGGSNR